MLFSEKIKELLLDKGYMIVNSAGDQCAMKRTKNKTSLLIRPNQDQTFTIYLSQVEGVENESFRSESIDLILEFGDNYF